MSTNMIGIINLIHETDELELLSSERCVASVPFGSRYRLIDFTLSSMVNSGISKVAVFAHTKYRSLMDHLGSGRDWDLNNRHSGLFVLPPVSSEIIETRRGDLFHFYQHRDFFQRSPLEYVLVTRSHIVANVDFDEVLHQHLATNADITLVTKRQSDLLGGNARKVMTDHDGRITALQESYGTMETDLVSMEMYVMRKDLLIDLVETSLAQGQDHLVRHAIMSRIGSLHVRAYEYNGYLGVVNTLPSYYQNSMNLLNQDVWKSLFFEPGPIFTKVKNEPPARYKSGARSSNSIIANGCVIEGTVENSILFRGVHIAPGAVVRNSIIMQNCTIGPNSTLDNAILDKDVRIDADREVRGASTLPFIAGKRKVI